MNISTQSVHIVTIQR